MKIELSSPTLLKISWPLFDDAIDHEIRKRLSTVPGIEAGRGRVAWAPVIQLARLIELFPKSSIGYAAMQESDRLGKRFYESLVRLHVNLQIDPMAGVCAVGDNVSPLIEQLVMERSHALKPFVEEAMKHPVPMLRGPLPEIPVTAGTLIEAQYPRRRRAKGKKAKA